MRKSGDLSRLLLALLPLFPRLPLVLLDLKLLFLHGLGFEDTLNDLLLFDEEGPDYPASQTKQQHNQVRGKTMQKELTVVLGRPTCHEQCRVKGTHHRAEPQ